MGNGESKTESNDEKFTTHMHVFRFEHRQGALIETWPTNKELNKLCESIKDKLYTSKTEGKWPNNERNYDTVAAGVDIKQKTLYVATNVKKRKADRTYAEFGLQEADNHTIVETIRQVNTFKNLDIRVVTTETPPRNPEENGKDHAEMQLLSFVKTDPNGAKIDRLGSDKPPCARCKKNLDDNNIEYNHDREGQQDPHFYAEPEEIATRVSHHEAKKTVRENKIIWTHNLTSDLDQLKMRAKESVKLKRTYTCNITTTNILDTYDNYDRKMYCNNEMTYADMGTYNSARSMRKGAYAKAGLFSANAGVSFVDVSVSVMTITANAEVGLVSGVSAGVNLKFACVDVNVGPVHLSLGIKASMGASIGPDGIEVEILGTGFSFSLKKIEIKTFFIDLSINPSACVAILFVAVVEFLKKFDGQNPPPAATTGAIPIDLLKICCALEILVEWNCGELKSHINSEANNKKSKFFCSN